MNQQQHIIGRTILEIDSDRLEEMWRFQQDISDIFQEQAIPAMEQLFDQLVGADEVVRLERVVVELEPIARHDLAEEFVANLLVALQELLSDRLRLNPMATGESEAGRPELGDWSREGQGSATIQSSLEITPRFPLQEETRSQKHRRSLREALSDRGESEVSQRDRAEAYWEVLLYFLQYGRLPWWCLWGDWEAAIANWPRVMQQGSHWQTSLGRLLNSSASARKRLVSQFPEALRHQIILQLQPTWVNWSRRLREARQLMQALSISDRYAQTLETQAWLWVVSQLGFPQRPSRSHSSGDRPFPTLAWLEDWLTHLLERMIEEGLMTRSADESDNNRQPSSSPMTASSDRGFKADSSGETPSRRSISYSDLQTAIESLDLTDTNLWFNALERAILSVCGSSSPSTIGDRARTMPEESNLGSDRSLQNPFTEEQTSVSSQHREQSQTAADRSPEHQLRESQADSGTENDASLSSEQGEQDRHSRESSIIGDENLLPKTEQTSLSPEEADLGLFVKHSGLVILHPFLIAYFEAVGLLRGEGFPNRRTQEMAIYLLHYLATGQTDVPEYELVLPKLLCDWPLNEPVTPPQGLPEASLTEAEHLLQTVIIHWSVLKNTSPDGLREGFLQRQGKLTTLEQGDWRLQVEQTAIDVLLSRLPWGLNAIKLPWMKTLLMVEWI